MAAIDFPASPTVGQDFVAPNGTTYRWNGLLWGATGAASGYLPLSGGALSGDLYVGVRAAGVGDPLAHGVAIYQDGWVSTWANNNATGIDFEAFGLPANQRLWQIFNPSTTGGPLRIEAVADDWTTIQSYWQFNRNGDTVFSGVVDIKAASGFGAMQIAGPDGAYLDLTSPGTDDFDLRMWTNGSGGSIQSNLAALTVEAIGAFPINFVANAAQKFSVTPTGVQLSSPLIGTTYDTHALFGGYQTRLVGRAQGQGATGTIQITNWNSPATNSNLSLFRFSNSQAGPSIIMAHSRTTTIGGHGAALSGDTMGTISFNGSDGFWFNESASIRARVDAAITSGTSTDLGLVPSRLEFFVTPVGGFGATEAMRISSNLSTTFNGIVNVTATAGFAQMELGGVAGATLDLKAPASDDFDLRLVAYAGSNSAIQCSSDLYLQAITSVSTWISGVNKFEVNASNVQAFVPLYASEAYFNVLNASAANLNGNVQTGSLNVTGTLTGTSAAFSGNVSASNTLTVYGSGGVNRGVVSHDNVDMHVRAEGTGHLTLGANGVDFVRMANTGNFYPLESNIRTLGLTTNYWRSINVRLVNVVGLTSGEVQIKAPDVANAQVILPSASGTLALQSEVAAVALPVGSIIDFAGAAAPTGWLMCNAQAVSRASYAALYAALGGAASPYGQGDGTSTFNVPDLRGRVTAGPDAGQNRLNIVNNNNLGASGGEGTTVLSTAHLAAHAHSGPSHAHTIPSHAHTASGTGLVGNNLANGTTRAVGTGDGINAGYFQELQITVDGSGQLGTDAAGNGATGNAGSGTAHNNTQATMVLNKIIKF
jgi:microcystin-dependent protein